MSFKIQLRRDLSSNWTSINPVLMEGEFGYETDSRRAKIGDGVSSYNSLPYWPDTNSLDLYGPTGSFQTGATGIGITGDMVTTQIIGNVPYYKIEGATTRLYCVRFEYDGSDNLSGAYTILSNGPWTSTGLTVSTDNSPQKAIFNFDNELTPPKNIFGYFYKATLDVYTLTTFGKGADDLVTTSTLYSNKAGAIVTNNFFDNFSAGNFGNNDIEIIMTLSNYGGARSGINNAHAYVIFMF